MKASLQSTASEFVPGDQKPAGPVGGAKGSPSLTGTLSATPFVPSPKLLVGLEAPPFTPGGPRPRAAPKYFSRDMY